MGISNGLLVWHIMLIMALTDAPPSPSYSCPPTTTYWRTFRSAHFAGRLVLFHTLCSCDLCCVWTDERTVLSGMWPTRDFIPPKAAS